MRRTPILAVTLLATVLLSACGSSSSKTTSSSSGAAASETTQTTASQSGGEDVVKTASNSSVGGTILVDAQGMTLYRLSGEKSGKFICTSSACTQVWHPLTATSEATPAGTVGSLGTVKRPDGTLQVTYNGEPLYTFAQDTKPGQAGGQGLKDVGTWNVVSASASGAGPAATTSKEAEAPKSSGGGYGY